MIARERELLALMVQDLSHTEITERLVVTRATVEFRITSVLSNRGLSRRTQASALALNNKLL